MANHAALAVYSCIDSRCISKCLVILLASQEACNPDTDTPYAVCTASCQAHAVVQALPALLAFCSLLECKQVFQNMPAVVTCMHPPTVLSGTCHSALIIMSIASLVFMQDTSNGRNIMP